MPGQLLAILSFDFFNNYYCDSFLSSVAHPGSECGD